MSPLAEGRELKFCIKTVYNEMVRSPLAEGRELKYFCHINGAYG